MKTLCSPKASWSAVMQRAAFSFVGDGMNFTSNKCCSKGSVKNPRAPADIAPKVSPWYAPSSAMMFTFSTLSCWMYFWMANFKATSMEVEPLSEKKNFQSCFGKCFGKRSHNSMAWSCVKPAKITCSKRSSWAFILLLMCGCACPCKFTHHDEMASITLLPFSSNNQTPSARIIFGISAHSFIWLKGCQIG